MGYINYFSGIVIFLWSVGLYSQEKFTLSGVVFDKESNETLIGVNVVQPELKVGTTTNEYGFYSITLPTGKHKIAFSYLGYLEKVVEVDLTTADVKLDVKLSEESQYLGEVVITADPYKTKIDHPEMSVNKLSI